MGLDAGNGSSGARQSKKRSSKSRGEGRGFERLIAELCGAFVRATVEEIDEEINRWLKHIVLILGLDRATVAEINSLGWGSFSHGWARDPEQIIRQPLDANVLLPWLLRKMAAGETVVIERLDDLPEEAAVDRESFRGHGTKSNVTIPIRVGGEVVGGVGFATMHRQRKWPPTIVEQLRLVAEILGYALERKRSVSVVRRLREELVHVSRITTVGELAASMAHELNQPLAAIMTNAEAAELLLASEPPNLEEARAALREVVHDDQRASDIIGRFRQLFKRRELRKSTLSAGDLLDAVERIVRSRATITEVSLIVRSAPSLPPIWADPILIQQVLINLIMNGFDSVGTVAEGPREVEVSAFSSEPGFLNFSVRDTGTGIEPRVMRQLFDSFFTTKPEGLGMGLAIARSIVEAHGGRLWARRNAERGATFEFTLPAASEP